MASRWNKVKKISRFRPKLTISPEETCQKTERARHSLNSAASRSFHRKALTQRDADQQGNCPSMATDLNKAKELAEFRIILAVAQLVWHPNLRLHKITQCPNDHVAFSLIPAEIDDAGAVHPTDPAIVTVMDADPARAMSRAIEKSLAQIDQAKAPVADILTFARRR